MPSEFESGFLGGGLPAWHRLGNVRLEDVLDAEQAMYAAELAWLVEERELMTTSSVTADEIKLLPITTHKAIVRTSDDAILGVVGQGFQPIQNLTAFQFLDQLVDSGEAQFHTAGSLRGGKRVWVLAKLTRELRIAGDPDEELHAYLLAVNAHDGTLAFTVINTPVRVVCMNTLTLALRGALRAFRVRHTQGLKGRVEEARRTLGLAVGYYDLIQQLGDELIAQSVDERELERFLEKLVPTRADDGHNKAGQAADAERRRLVRVTLDTTDNLQNIKRTRWGLVQAVAQFEDWSRYDLSSQHVSDDRRFERTLLETGLKQRALAILAPHWASRAAEVVAP